MAILVAFAAIVPLSVFTQTETPVSDNAVVARNIIGLKASGSGKLANCSYGVTMPNANDSTSGGSGWSLTGTASRWTKAARWSVRCWIAARLRQNLVQPS
ncbi:MAG: hypothetical protein KDI07_03775 [Anaerolineae bacterium]|nr:hypothetical protein [Anaerolineae bacterium]MCB9131858.1 hypothetical protein [Anaerolineales bacterium]MCB0228581.1 hypothetical protein [Anaerolineae bacterium]MCB0233142.1 hypothetical protein [Anaerolineae bacterium]MCB0240620.1 hypothetical protein [Anaerolineae bacterium]